MLAFKLGVLSVSAVLLASTAASSRTDPSPCRLPDAASSDMLEHYRWIDTTTDKGHITWRQSIGLSSVAVTQIVLATDTVVCRRAVTAYNSILADDSMSASIAVDVVK